MKKLTPLLFVLALAGFAAADDWPQWRGPHRDDVSQETGLLKTWPKDGPKLLWTFKDAGVGYSAPAIVGDTLYCMGADDKNDDIFALDMNTQAKKWSTPIGPRITLDRGDGPRGCPTVDGDLVFGISSKGDLICVKATSGEKVWLKELKGKDFGGEMMSGWGYSESPLVDGDMLVCTPAARTARWPPSTRRPANRPGQQGLDRQGRLPSIVPADIGGVHQLIQLTADTRPAGPQGRQGAVELQAARQHGRDPHPDRLRQFVFITSGYGGGCSLVQITGDAEAGFQAKEVEKNNNMTNHHGGVVKVGDFLYGYDDNKGLECLKFKDTSVVWSHKGEHGKMSVVCADGQLYWYGEKDGEVLLVEPCRPATRRMGVSRSPSRPRGRVPRGAGSGRTRDRQRPALPARPRTAVLL